MARKKGKGSGFESRVSSRYRKAGYKVERNVVGIRNGKRYEIDAIIKRKNERYVAEMKSGKQVLTKNQILNIHKKLIYRKGDPLLLIGPNVGLTEPAKKAAKHLGLKIRRVRW